MLTSSEITDAPREVARAMLQLLFLMGHSQAGVCRQSEQPSASAHTWQEKAICCCI